MIPARSFVYNLSRQPPWTTIAKLFSSLRFKKVTSGSITTNLSILFTYRITPHTKTGISPAEFWEEVEDVKPHVEEKQLQQKAKHDVTAKSRVLNCAVFGSDINGPDQILHGTFDGWFSDKTSLLDLHFQLSIPSTILTLSRLSLTINYLTWHSNEGALMNLTPLNSSLLLMKPSCIRVPLVEQHQEQLADCKKDLLALHGDHPIHSALKKQGLYNEAAGLHFNCSHKAKKLLTYVVHVHQVRPLHLSNSLNLTFLYA